MNPPLDVVQRYPALVECRLQFLGNRGGFSGARLWRAATSAGDFCVKAWPAGALTAERLSWIHRLLQTARTAGVDFVPQPLASAAGSSVVVHAGQLWDISTWLPGAADFHEHRSDTRLAAAGTGLARLHRAWHAAAPSVGPCPGVGRRLDTVRRWRELLSTGWQPTIASDDPVRLWAERAWQLLPRAVTDAERALAAWRDVSVPLHPCWCDPWHDHVLFTGDHVTGLIDFGSVKVDHAAIDLARLLGSFVGDEYARWEVALAAYRAVRPLTEQESVLIAVLEQAGLMNALVNWLRWLYHERRDFEDRPAVAKRLQIMVTRLEKQLTVSPTR